MMNIRSGLAAAMLLGLGACSGGSGRGGNGVDPPDSGGTAPVVSIAAASTSEGGSGSTVLSFVVTLSEPSTREVTVAYASADGTAAAGIDYTAVSGVLSFPAGTSARSIEVSIAGDQDLEPDETFSVVLSDPAQATLGAAQAIGTILNDDLPVTEGPLQQKAANVLPPGQSGFFSVAGQAAGSASGVPADYGPHVDDQRLLYWNYGAKAGALGARPGTPAVPKEGIEVYRDAHGVPIVYAPNVRDLWHGVGYAVAQDRLFLMDAVRRMGQGTFGELTGCGGVPGDIQQRTVAYTAGEYQGFFDALTPDAKDAVLGYVDGANAWRAEVMADPSLLPAEYGLLSTQPAAFTVQDVLAAGVYITRFVAAEGGNEFLNIKMLQGLAAEYGSADEAIKAFADMTWLEDPKAAVSVPASSGSFPNQEPGDRDAAYRTMAAWALTLPDTLWKGDGTGHAAAPGECETPPMPGIGGIGGGLGAGEVRVATKPLAATASKHPVAKRRWLAARTAERARAAREAVRGVVHALLALRAHLHGGSMAYAIGTSRTRDGGTLMVSGPQLGYTYPTLLVEYEIHGGGYHARGVSVPILPVVGIGYTADVAWGLTTGYSKTIDSFIETICSTAQASAGTCEADQYFHDGQWKDMECRTETIPYRAAQQGLPVGPPVLSRDAKICRTVHGPVVARDDAIGRARSLQYGMWKREIDTIEGVRQWNKATSFAEFMAGAEKVTWNENVTFATRDGHIGFIHPGLIRRRPANGDMRLPVPGTGSHDFGAPYSFAELPKAIDPEQGYVANWNNKPAYGWLDGEGLGATSRPGGPGQRLTSILDLLASRDDWSYADLAVIDRHHGVRDHRAREYLPLVQAFGAAPRTSALGAVHAAALQAMLDWDRKAYADTIDPAAAAPWLDTPGATIFGAYVLALREELFGGLRDVVLDAGVGSPDPNDPDPGAGLTAYARLAGVGSHVFDQSVMDNLILRILQPSHSGLALRRDYTGGRTRDQIMQAALDRALAQLAADYNDGNALTVADLSKLRRAHPASQICSLTDVIGPGSTTPTGECVPMPYQDRGSWVHRVGWERP